MAWSVLIGCDSVQPAETFSTELCHAASDLPDKPVVDANTASNQWAPPAAVPLRLVERNGTISGTAAAAAKPLLRLDKEDLAAWTPGEWEELGLLQSPRLPGVSGTATELTLVVRPNGLRKLGVVVSPATEIEDKDRKHRRIEFALDGSPDIATLQVDLTDVLTGNWNDERRKAIKLKKVELVGNKKALSAAVFEELRLDGPGAAYGHASAGTHLADLAGELRPSWFVHSGAEVRFELDVPAGAPVLHWYDGLVGDKGVRTVAIDHEGKRTEVARTVDSDGWTPLSVDLASWAGQRVELVLGAEQGGIGLFGEARIEQVAPHTTPNVIVYMVDTLRADHLGAWGNPLPSVSPQFDALAANGATFWQALSTSPWTKPAIPSLLTGIWPTRHGVGSTAYTDRLQEGVPTLQQILGKAGWRTGSFSASPLGSTLSGLEQDFDVVMPPRRWRHELTKLKHVTAEQLHDKMFEWMDADPDMPFFAYIHTMEVHGWRRSPFKNPPEGTTSYELAIQKADERFAHLLAGLQARDALDDTLIVFTSDHGESFGDHGVKNHGSSLYQSQIHIPLVFSAGDSLPAFQTNQPVSLADIAPTLLDLVGVRVPETMDGLSLAPVFAGEDTVPRAFVPSARIRYIHQATQPKIYSMVTPQRRKLVRKWKRYTHQFDLAKDPCESTAVAENTDEMKKELTRWVKAQHAQGKAFQKEWGSAAGGGVQASDVQMLKEMGYIE